MNKKVKKRKIITAIFILFIFFVWLNNTSLFISHENIGYKFLAHRGLAQTFDESKSAPKNFPGFIWTNRIDIVNPATTGEYVVGQTGIKTIFIGLSLRICNKNEWRNF